MEFIGMTSGGHVDQPKDETWKQMNAQCGLRTKSWLVTRVEPPTSPHWTKQHTNCASDGLLMVNK